MENKTKLHADHAQVLQSTRSKYYGEISGLSVNLLIDIPHSAAAIPKYFLHSQTT